MAQEVNLTQLRSWDMHGNFNEKMKHAPSEIRHTSDLIKFHPPGGDTRAQDSRGSRHRQPRVSPTPSRRVMRRGQLRTSPQKITLAAENSASTIRAFVRFLHQQRVSVQSVRASKHSDDRRRKSPSGSDWSVQHPWSLSFWSAMQFPRPA